MSKSGLTPYQDECILILQEECAEVSQEICKIFRFGIEGDSHHALGKDHRACLESEIGDLLAMIEMVIDSDIGLTQEGINAAKEKKLEKVVKWMTHKKPVPVEPGSTADVMQKAFALAKSQLNGYKVLKVPK